MREPAPKYRKLETRFGLIFGLAGVFIALSIALVYSFATRTQLLSALREQTMVMLQLSVLDIQSDSLESIKQTGNPQSEESLVLQETLEEILQANPRLLGVYLLQADNLAGWSVLAAATPANTVRYGDPLNGLPPFQTVDGEMIEPQVKESEWIAVSPGMWGVVPVRDSYGKTAGILALWVDLTDLNSRVFRQIALLTTVMFGGVIMIGVVGWLMGKRLTKPVNVIARAIERIEAGNLEQTVEIHSQDEMGVLAEKINRMQVKLRNRMDSLLEENEGQTIKLEERNRHIDLGLDIAGICVLETNQDQLAQKVVEKVLSGFHLLNATVFLLEKDKNMLRLAAGAGADGKKLAQKGFFLSPAEGLVGSCFMSGKMMEAMGENPSNTSPIIPEWQAVQSEAVVPLRLRGEITGIITVHATRSKAFDQETLSALSIIADQTSLALDNIHLLKQYQEAVQTVSRVYGELSRKAWQDLLRTRGGLVARCDEKGSRVDKEKASGTQPGSGSLLPKVSLPIRVRGQVIGAFEAHKAKEQDWTRDELALLETLMDQLSIALESARLYNESQRRAERERMAGEITARLRSSNDPQAILQTAVRELHQALQAQQAQVLLQASQTTTKQASRTENPGTTLANREIRGNGHQAEAAEQPSPEQPVAAPETEA